MWALVDPPTPILPKGTTGVGYAEKQAVAVAGGGIDSFKLPSVVHYRGYGATASQPALSPRFPGQLQALSRIGCRGLDSHDPEQRYVVAVLVSGYIPGESVIPFSRGDSWQGRSPALGGLFGLS